MKLTKRKGGPVMGGGIILWRTFFLFDKVGSRTKAGIYYTIGKSLIVGRPGKKRGK